jgi:hypothetical protein
MGKAMIRQKVSISRKDPDQSARFIEAAKKVGADETGKKFERALKKIVKTKANRKLREEG